MTAVTSCEIITGEILILILIPGVDVMLELRKFVAPEFVFGLDSTQLVSQYALNFGALKAFVVTDEGVAKCDVVGTVCDLFQQAGISHKLYTDISPDPREEQGIRYALERE